MQLLDTVEIDYCRAVRAGETAWVELLLEALHRVAEKMLPATHVQSNVVAFGLYPIDLLDTKKVSRPPVFSIIL